MLNDVNVNPAPKRFVQPLPLRPSDNLVNREVCRFGMIAVQQSSRDPDFIRYFQGGLDPRIYHDAISFHNFNITM